MTVHRTHGVARNHAESIPETDTGRHRRAQKTATSRTGWVVLAAVMVTVGVGGAVAWTTTHEARGGGATVSAPATDRDVADWMRSNLPPDSLLLADGIVTPPELSSVSIGQPDLDWHDFDYFVTEPGEKPLDTSAEAVWQSSLPIAIFPDVQIRQIVDGSTAEYLRSREADRADRLVAGTSLLANPNIVAAPAVASRLTEGGLDMRAASALTALAGAMRVEVAGVEDVEAEAAAGLPARSMTVRVVDTRRATTVLSGLTAAFRAEQVIATPDGAIRLHWPLRFAPLPSVS